MAEDRPGDFGRYVLTELIGEGGMAEVYRATVRVAEGLTKWVVIKKIRRDFADQPEFTRMFVEEAKIALSLNHANIVQVFDFGQVRGDFYLAMELIEGLDLMRLFHAVRGRGESFPAVIAAYVAHQVASGLAYAHRKRDDYGRELGIVHRDVSPHNIMISFEGQVKVLDFGIARARGEASVGRDRAARELAEQETIKGKVAYMSPEQALGKKVDPRSDVYSLGVVLYELLAGELLFRSRDRLAALERVRTEPIPPILEKVPEIPDELGQIVDRALARDPEARYPSARAMQSDLARFLHRADPVVDDEALSNYLSRFRIEEQPRPGLDAARDLDDQLTREVADSQVSGMGPGIRRTHRRLVLLHGVLEPRQVLEDRPRPDVAPFQSVVRDVAFKRDAHIHEMGRNGFVLAFGTALSTGDDAERALRVALALREAIGETAPGIGLGLALVDTHVVVQRDDHGHMTIELPTGLSVALERIARRGVDDRVTIAGALIERLSRSWRMGASYNADPRLLEGSAGSPWAAEIQLLAPLLGPLSEAERRAHQVPGRRNELFGRELELKALRDAFTDAIRSRRSRSLVVIGEPGIGKRALVDRFVASLPRGSAAVLRGVGLWSQRNQPFSVFLEVLRRFLRIGKDTTTRELAQRLSDYGVHESDKLADALADALGLAPHGDRDIEPLERRDRLARLVRRLIRVIARRQPVLIVIENLHFVDEESFQIIEEWAEERHDLPILGLSTSRTSTRAELLAQRPTVNVIRLGELDEQARRSLIVRRFEDPKEAEELAEAIVARTGGNPLFIEEILASLLHRGIVGWNPQGRYLVVRERGAKIELPPSIEGALQARVEQLEPDPRDALQAAAVLGRRFRVQELSALLDRDVSNEVQHLVGESFLEPDAPAESGRATLRFVTVSMHEVCKESLAEERGRELHSRAAQIKLARPDYTPGRDDGPIADHLIAAGEMERAIEPALRAAHDAQDVAGNVEAYYYLSQALKAMHEDDARRFDTLLEREPVLRAWGRRRAQGADIRQMRRIAETLGDAERMVIVHTRQVRFYLECGRIKSARRALPELEREIQALERPEPFLAVLGELRADLLFALGDFEEAERSARDALPYCWTDRRGIRQRCRLLSSIGRVQLGTGRYEEAETTFGEVLVHARSIRHRRLEAEALNNLGEVAGKMTRYQLAVDRFRDALALDRELGDRFATGTKLANLGMTYTAIGLYRRAERFLRKALELHEAIGHPGLLNEVVVNLGEVVGAFGDLEGARALLEDAARLAADRGDVRTELRARVKLAMVLLRARTEAGREEAAALASSVEARARAHGLRSAACRALYVLSVAAEDRGETETAIEHAEAAVRLFEAGAAPVDGVLAIHQLGRLLVVGEASERGQALLDDARARVQARLDDLRDPDLREGYLQQLDVRRVLEGLPA